MISWPKSIVGFIIKVQYFSMHQKFRQRVIHILRNQSAKQPQQFEVICFLGESCFDEAADSMPAHAQPHKKAIWITQGHSNQAYMNFWCTNLLTATEIAADTLIGYVWQLNKQACRTLPTPDINDCRLSAC
jgi:hypothetical protein